MTERKVQFGSGPKKLHPSGWENYDKDVNISRPLKFGDGSVDYILAEHVIEHVPCRAALQFLEECYRVLRPNGVARIIVPGLERYARRAGWEHLEYMKKRGWIADISTQQAVKVCIRGHGHLSWWTEELLEVVMEAVGFETDVCWPHQSRHEALQEVDCHHKDVGIDFNLMESVVVEGSKRVI